MQQNPLNYRANQDPGARIGLDLQHSSMCYNCLESSLPTSPYVTMPNYTGMSAHLYRPVSSERMSLNTYTLLRTYLPKQCAVTRNQSAVTDQILHLCTETPYKTDPLQSQLINFVTLLTNQLLKFKNYFLNK